MKYYDLTKENRADEVADDLKAYRGKWRNLWFTNAGEYMHGGLIYDDEQTARDHIDKELARTRSPERINMRRTAFSAAIGRNVFNHEISHAIPMPIGDA